MNQFSQKGFVSFRLVRQTHGRAGSEGVSSSYRSEGTETRAEVLFRIVRERVLFYVSHCFKVQREEKEKETYCHSIPAVREGKRVGRVARYFSMPWRASIADPGASVSDTDEHKREVI